jgi:beta-glucosidase
MIPLKKTLSLLSLVALIFGLTEVRAEDTILTGVDLPAIDAKVKKLVEQMTLDEKMYFMHGSKDKLHYDGPPPIPRLGIPEYVIAHGPYSARATFTDAKTGKHTISMGTFMSCSINFAACWDPELVRKVSQGVGKEIRSAGDYSLAGPAFNIVRDLRDGRSAEYFTEDPYLNAQMVTPFVMGLQSEHAIATLKHYACNNQEWNRGRINVVVSKRALNEIYLPGFEYAVKKADAMSVMSAYNLVNGQYCAQNSYLLEDRLRKTWGFKGFVMSDWSGTHSTVPTVMAGLDLEMPNAEWYGNKLKQAVDSGEVPMSVIDERVSNILRTMFVAKCFDPDFKNPPMSVYKSSEMKELAHQLALNSIVLLKNEGNTLPFSSKDVKTVAVIGPHSSYGPHFNEGRYDYTLFQEGGSANVAPQQNDMITPLLGVQQLLGSKVKVVNAPGCYAENGCGPIPSTYLVSKDGKPGLSASYFSGVNFKEIKKETIDPTVSFEWDKDPLIPEAGKESGSKAKFSARWEGKLNAPETRDYTFELRFEGIAAVFIDGKQIFADKANNEQWWKQVNVQLAQGQHDIKIDYQKSGSKGIMRLWWDYENIEWTKQAVEAAKNADAVIVAVGNSGNAEREGRDRYQGLLLSKPQENLINAVGKANPKTVVVTFTAGVGMENWIHSVPAVMQAMYPGEQAGKALAELIFGESNPSGKLSVSIPKSEDQYPKDHWGSVTNINYNEDVFVGYRYFDENKIEPQFPFGYGLSYTTFSYGEPKLSTQSPKVGEPVTVSVDVTNSGQRAGAEVVQLYVHQEKPSVPRPPKELKGFQKIFLKPGETKTVTLPLDNRSFAYFSEQKNDWVVEPGKFDILIGSSSRDIRQKASLTMAP